MITRRDFLRSVTAGVGAVLSGSVVASAAPTAIWGRRAGETFRVDIGTRSGYEAMRYLLRDVRAGVIGFPHVDLCRRLAWIQTWVMVRLDQHVPIDFTSGLRMPSTNASIEGAAQNSSHLPNEELVFWGADWRMKGVDSALLSELSVGLARHTGSGGTGLYVGRDFIHSDVVRAPRTWRRR